MGDVGDGGRGWVRVLAGLVLAVCISWGASGHVFARAAAPCPIREA